MELAPGRQAGPGESNIPPPERHGTRPGGTEGVADGRVGMGWGSLSPQTQLFAAVHQESVTQPGDAHAASGRGGAGRPQSAGRKQAASGGGDRARRRIGCSRGAEGADLPSLGVTIDGSSLGRYHRPVSRSPRNWHIVSCTAGMSPTSGDSIFTRGLKTTWVVCMARVSEKSHGRCGSQTESQRLRSSLGT